MPSRWMDDDLFGSRFKAGGWRRFALAPAALLGGWLATQSAQARMPALEPGTCRVESVGGESYTICSFDPARHRFTVRLNGADAKPYRKLARATDAHPNALVAMNGGMYHDDLSPVGLYVEDGARSKKLQRKPSWGNFGLVPNGVFWVRGREVGVTETLAFDGLGVKPDFATQSGPMLVIDGKLHPRFLKNSDSYKVRNGVGVARDGTVHFAMSHGAVNFWTFAKLFQRHLDSPNALFLDGSVSAIRASGFSRGGFWTDLGPMILVEPISPNPGAGASPADAAAD